VWVDDRHLVGEVAPSAVDQPARQGALARSTLSGEHDGTALERDGTAVQDHVVGRTLQEQPGDLPQQVGDEVVVGDRGLADLPVA
jgi:hypothetical protein